MEEEGRSARFEREGARPCALSPLPLLERAQGQQGTAGTLVSLKRSCRLLLGTILLPLPHALPGACCARTTLLPARPPLSLYDTLLACLSCYDSQLSSYEQSHRTWCGPRTTGMPPLTLNDRGEWLVLAFQSLCVLSEHPGLERSSELQAD